jgi:hypothetical protein
MRHRPPDLGLRHLRTRLRVGGKPGKEGEEGREEMRGKEAREGLVVRHRCWPLPPPDQ